MNISKGGMVKSSFKWSFVIQFTIQFTQFVVSVVLARLLFPEDFGLIGMLAIFISVGKLITDGGLGQSIIRTKNPEDDDYSTVFIFSLLTSLLIYLLLFVGSPFVATFFEEPILADLLRIYGLSLIIAALSTVQSIKINKALQFKTQFKLLLPSIIISSVVAIYMATEGYGVWSLVAKEIIFSSLATIQLWMYSDFLPKLKFNKEKFKMHFGFSSNLLLSGMLGEFFNNSFNIIIGKLFSATQLGLYTRAKSISLLPGGFIFHAVNRVMFPLLSSIGDDNIKLKKNYKKISGNFGFAVIPILIAIGFLAKPLILVLLTDKWEGAIAFLQLLMIVALFEPFQKLLMNILKVKGNSRLILKITIIQYVLITVGVLSTFWIGIFSLLGSLVVVTVLKYLLTAHYVGRLVHYSVKEQIQDILEPILYSLVSGILVVGLLYLMNAFVILNGVAELLLCSILFAIFYLTLGQIFKNQVQQNLLEKCKRFITSNSKR